MARAQKIIDTATELGVTQFHVFAADIAKGNDKLNMGFTAAIFNHLPGLESSADEGNFNPALAHPSAEIKEGGRKGPIYVAARERDLVRALIDANEGPFPSAGIPHVDRQVREVVHCASSGFARSPCVGYSQ